MSHRAQQIVDAIVANLAANATPNWAVYRTREIALSVAEMELPAVSVFFGEDAPFNEYGQTNTAFIDSVLKVTVAAIAEGATEDDVTPALLDMRRQTHISLMADRSQGLAFVIDTRYQGASDIEFDVSASRLAGVLQTHWHVHYRMNLTDPA